MMVTLGIVLCVVGVASLTAIVVTRSLEWQRGDVPAAARFPPSGVYAFGLWCLPTGIGAMSAGIVGAVVLGVAAAAALVLAVVPRSGMRFDDADVCFGAHRIPLDNVATIVRSPTAQFGRAFGTWGIADADGAWIAAFRPHAARHGSAAVRALIDRAGLVSAGDGRIWTTPDATAPATAFPAFAR